MAGLWRHLWVRGGVTLVLGSLMMAIVSRLDLQFVIGGYPAGGGVLDFAGGTVVHVSRFGPLSVLALLWGSAEFIQWRVGRVAPLGSYVIFIAGFVIGFEISRTSLVLNAGISPLLTAAMLVAIVGVPLLLAWLYARLRWRRGRPSAPDAF